MLNFSLRQSYYTDENASKFDNSYSYGFNQRAPNAFSPISLMARATPTAPLAIDYRLEYDPLATTTSPKLLGMSLNGMLRSPDVNVTGGWSRQAFTQTTPTGAVVQANNIVQSTADFRIKQGQYGGAVQFYYDVTKSTLINQRYVASYNAQCCGVSFEYQIVQLSQYEPVPGAEGPALQHVVHAGRRRVVRQLLRGVRRRHVLAADTIHRFRGTIDRYMKLVMLGDNSEVWIKW